MKIICDCGREVSLTTQCQQFSNEIRQHSTFVTFSIARELFGQDFYGAAEIERTFGIRPTDLPPIPFTYDELKRAHSLGHMLICRQSFLAGNPVTIAFMDKRMGALGKQPARWDIANSWSKDEAFQTSETSRQGWALVAKDVLPGSTNKNFWEQTELLAREYSQSMAHSLAVTEWDGAKDHIKSFMSSDWKEAARQLSALNINRLTRQTAVEVIYDALLRREIYGVQPLQNMYTWTSDRVSGGGLVYVGDFASDGAGVYYHGPRSAAPNLGVVFSRSS